MTTPDTTDSPVVLTHPTNPDLRGPVTFKLPSLMARIAIHRRVVELINAGRAPHLPKIHPMELEVDGYKLAHMVATLEHTIVTAPKGLYRVNNGRAELAVGALSELEDTEPDGIISLLYAGYEEWRDRFRVQRNGRAEGTDEIGRGEDHRGRGEERGTGPTGGAGAAGGPADDRGREPADSRTAEPEERRE